MIPATSAMPELLSYLDSMAEPHIVMDTRYRIVAANATYRRELAGGQLVVGRTCYAVSHGYTVPCDQAGESCPLANSLASGARERVLHLHHTPDGEAYVNIELTPIRDAVGDIRFFVEKMQPLPATDRAAGAVELIGRSPAFLAMLGLVARVGPAAAAVLLQGESGSGKELVAQAIHASSPRASAPFVAVDCSGLPETLFESELFGHERGAFTGAVARKTGLVESASGGTLFLDEVGDIPLSLQVKLLRLLETGTYRRVGSTELRRADIRVISATHRSLRRMVDEGAFRQDLFFRLNTFPIEVPPLRERRGDIPLLVQGLLNRVAPGRNLRLSAAAEAVLQGYGYPGNVRELRNVLERASLMCDGTVIGVDHLPAELRAVRPSVDEPKGLKALQLAGLRAVVQAHRGSRADLARKLGVSERTLYRKLRALARPGP